MAVCRMPPATQRLNMLFSATLSYRLREPAFEQDEIPLEYVKGTGAKDRPPH